MTAVLSLLAKVPLWAWVLLIALVVIGWQRAEVSHYRAKTITLQSAVKTFESAQTANLATIKVLLAANADWASKCKANEPEARHEAELSAQGDAKRQAAAQKSVKSLQATYAREPTVKAWADTRVPDAAVRMLTSAGQD
jgi:hypothetical protein